jgi:hypothetical protein
MQRVIDLAIGEITGDARIAEQLKNENLARDIVYYVNVTDPRIVNWAAAYFWARAGFSNSFRKIETDDIIKIFVQSTPEIEPCRGLADLACYEFLAIYAGFHEHVNNSLPNLFANLIEHRQMRRRYTWVFVKGKAFPVYSRYYYKNGERLQGETVGNVDIADFLGSVGFHTLRYEGNTTGVRDVLPKPQPVLSKPAVKPQPAPSVSPPVKKPEPEKKIPPPPSSSVAEKKITYAASDPGRAGRGVEPLPREEEPKKRRKKSESFSVS